MSVHDPRDSRFRSSLRRSACDRCRRLKLKCLRDSNTTETCLRCHDGAVECLTGPAKPLGRAARANIIPNRSGSGESPPRRGTDSSWNAPVDWSSRGENADSLVSTYAMHGNDLSSPPGIFDYNTLPEPSLGVPPSVCPLDINSSLEAIENIALHLPGSYITGDPVLTVGDFRGSDTNVSEVRSADLDFCQLNLALSRQLLFLTTNCTWREKLMSMMCAGDNPETSNHNSECSKQSSPLGEILRTTFEFVAALRKHLPPQEHSTPLQLDVLSSQSFWASLSSPQSTSVSSDDGSSSAPSLLSTPWSFEPSSFPVSSNDNGTATLAENSSELSIVTIPNLLSCYLHLVGIFNIIFRHIRTLLSQTPASSLSMLQSVPGLQLAGVQVEHGGLQMKILLQVIEHQFAIIETTLCLPDEHRVFTGHQTSWSHNIRQSVSAGNSGETGALLNDAIDINGFAPAKRIVAALRAEMANVRQLL
ncbi:hypothetical protein F4777DRAFT_273111 [Nemania sp. FL0916]|nr:hypothetical protein F4777DRAFT_273111 [Nemania sp. FL0916]